MTTLEFKIEINAPVEKVWFSMWDNDNYLKWTSAFCEGSYAVSDWKEGSRIHFLTPNGDGMYSVIEVLDLNKQMSFKHLGNIKNKEEQPLDEASKLWSGATENYYLESKGNVTILSVKMDVVDEYVAFFNESFTKGLDIIKDNSENFTIKIKATINENINTVWNLFTDPKHIVNWNTASEDWHTTKAENDFRKGGKFSYRMEAKDGSFGFDFEGIYDEIIKNEIITYTLLDNRIVKVHFLENEDKTIIAELFEPENQNSYELQKFGWQSILNNFKKYVETL